MREVVVQGSSVEEAIQQALIILGMERQDIKVQVLNLDSHGEKDLRRRPVLVRVWAEEKMNGATLQYTTLDVENTSENKLKTSPGETRLKKTFQQQPLAWIKEGKMLVEHAEEGPYPVVMPCSGVKLIVNGKEQSSAVIVNKGDDIRIKAVNEFQNGTWSFEISLDGMMVILNLKPNLELIREIEDLPPSPKLKLKVRETVLGSAPLSISDILTELNKRGVSIDAIDYNACTEASTCLEEKQIVVARGQAPEPGQNAQVQVLFSNQKKMLVLFGTQKKVDFRERFAFTSVEAGAIIARKIPPVPGNPGMSVLGKIIMPPPSQDIDLVVGKGVDVAEDGLTVIAKISGQPRAIPKGNKVYLDVLPLLVHPGDVDISSGNISFKGSLVIEGNVCEGMSVKASGDVRISGYVAHAMIHAEGSLVVMGNVLSSTLEAYRRESFLTEVIPILKELDYLITQMATAIEQIRSNPAFARANYDQGTIIKFLEKTRFMQLPICVKKLKSIIQTIPAETVGDRPFHLIHSAERVFISLRPERQVSHEISTIKNMIEEVIKGFSTQSLPTDGTVDLSYALNATIKAAGKVRVFGAGCYNTTISTNGPVEVEKVFRGGEIRAGGNVYVGELGSVHGTRTRIIVPANARVTIGKAWEDAEIRIGARIHHFKEKQDSIIVKLDARGDLSFVAKKPD